MRGTLAVQKALYRPGSLKRGAFEVLEVRWANPHSPHAAACPMLLAENLRPPQKVGPSGATIPDIIAALEAAASVITLSLINHSLQHITMCVRTSNH